MANPRDLARLMELAKKKAELEFGKNVLGRDTDLELKQVSKAHAELDGKVKAEDLEIIIPEAEMLDTLQKTVSEFQSDELREALKIRDGKAYHFLTERGRIVKRNFENRMEIAKISLIVSKLKGEEKTAVAQAIRKGSIDTALSISSVDGNVCKVLARLMRRCGILIEFKDGQIVGSEAENAEVRVEVSNRNIWVSKESKATLEENLKRIRQVNSVLQLKNAERQIKVFDNQEEDQFSGLQRQYLDLLKEQDEILKDYNEEEKI
jgi:hypothetical protein